MASPLARNPVEAPEASSSECPPTSSPSQNSGAGSSTNTRTVKSPLTPASPRPASEANLPLSPGGGRSRVRPTSASTRFPVAVNSNGLNRVSSPPLSPYAMVWAPKGRFREMFGPPEPNQVNTDIGQETMPMGLDKFDIGEASDDSNGASNPKPKSASASKENKQKDKGKGKEKTAAKSKGKGKEKEAKSRGNEKEHDNSKSKGKEVVRELLTPLRAKLAPIMHSRRANAEAGPSTQPQQQRDPGHKKLKLGNPSQEFSVVDVEAQTMRPSRETWTLWKVATAATMTLIVITFILVAAILWAVDHKL